MPGTPPRPKIKLPVKFAHFFIDRPIFASVVSLVIVLAGGLSLFRLPVAEYPPVVPPTVVVKAVYPGANPRRDSGHGGNAD